MIDPLLNRRLENCKKLLIHWRKFHEFLDRAIKGSEFTSQDEAEFLKLKSDIAILHDSLLESIENTKENMASAQSVISLIERCILLRQVQRMNPAEIKKMQIEWHESYLLVNETIGLLEEKIAKMAKVSYIVFVTKRAGDGVISSIGRVATNKMFHFFLGLAAVIIGLVVLPYMGVFNYDFLNNYDITKKMYAVGRGLARSTVMKNLEYQNWADYSWKKFNDGAKYFRKPMPDGFQPNEQVPPPVFVATINRMFVKNWPDLPAVDFRKIFDDTSKVEAKGTDANGTPEFYLKDQQLVAVFLCQFKKTADAISAESEIMDWENKIPATSPAKSAEAQITFGRVANFVYAIYSENMDHHPLVKNTLEGKVPGK